MEKRERLIRVSVLIFNEKQQVLLINMKRKNLDVFVLPGGGLEYGESITEGAKREVKEETNLDIEIKKLVYVKELYTKADESMDIILLGKIISGELKKGFDPEHGENQALHEVLWVSLCDLKKYDLHPKQLKRILAQDFEKGFDGTNVFLGRFNYPEDLT